MKRVRAQRGFGLVSALFLLVVMAAAGAIMVNLAGVERGTSVFALQGARAYHAARSGIEWGLWQARTGGACPAPTNFLVGEGGLVGFRVDVTCSSSRHTDNGITATVYDIVAVAEYGSFGAQDYVRRRLRATVTDAS